jgi:hypothetical protein
MEGGWKSPKMYSKASFGVSALGPFIIRFSELCTGFRPKYFCFAKLCTTLRQEN